MKPVVDNENARRADLAKIHIAKKDLGWDQAFYESILWSVCRVRSSSELDFSGRKRLLEHLRKCGWSARSKPKDRSQAADSQSRMIRGLWLELHELGYVDDPSETALAAWAKRETRIEALQWLSAAQAQTTIEKLKKWRDRDAKKLRPLALMLAHQGRVPSSDLGDLACTWFGTRTLTKDIAQQLLARLKAEAAR